MALESIQQFKLLHIPTHDRPITRAREEVSIVGREEGMVNRREMPAKSFEAASRLHLPNFDFVIHRRRTDDAIVVRELRTPNCSGVPNEGSNFFALAPIPDFDCLVVRSRNDISAGVGVREGAGEDGEGVALERRGLGAGVDGPDAHRLVARTRDDVRAAGVELAAVDLVRVTLEADDALLRVRVPELDSRVVRRRDDELAIWRIVARQDDAVVPVLDDLGRRAGVLDGPETDRFVAGGRDEALAVGGEGAGVDGAAVAGEGADFAEHAAAVGLERRLGVGVEDDFVGAGETRGRRPGGRVGHSVARLVLKLHGLRLLELAGEVVIAGLVKCAEGRAGEFGSLLRESEDAQKGF